VVEELLNAGADINACDVAGYTALHYAASGGHIETGRLLIARGADPR
jgi:ankyrin repeat protein